MNLRKHPPNFILEVKTLVRTYKGDVDLTDAPLVGVSSETNRYGTRKGRSESTRERGNETEPE